MNEPEDKRATGRGRSEAEGLRSGAPALLRETFAELQQANEELRVTGEEMQAQNEALAEAAQALEAERRRYSDLFHASPDPFFLTDLYGVIQEANPAAQEMLGVGPRTLRGKPLAVYVALDSRRAFRTGLLGGMGTREQGVYLHPKQGPMLYATLRVSPVVGAGGTPTGLRWLVRGATPDPGAKLERYHEVMDQVRDFAIVLLGADGRIVDWSVGADHIMGWSEAEAVGQDWAMIFTPEDREQDVPAQELAHAAAEGHTEEERWHVRKDGSRFWASGVVSAMREQSGRPRGFAKILRDATAQRRAQAELAAAYGELEAALVRERRTAEVLQRSLLLGPPVHAFAGLEVSTQYEPAGDDLLVGGDFHDAFHVTDEKVALVIGDVVGKGLGAAAHTAQIKFALRAFLRERPDPAEAVQRLNTFLCGCERLDGRAEDTESRFAVLCLVVIDTASGEALFAGMGTEPPLILRAGGGCEEVRTSGAPVGMMEGVRFGVTRVRLEAGDVVVLATDGLTEARQGKDFLGYDGMTKIAQRSLSLGPLAEVSTAIIEGARAFGGGFRDDVCVLLARRELI